MSFQELLMSKHNMLNNTNIEELLKREQYYYVIHHNEKIALISSNNFHAWETPWSAKARWEEEYGDTLEIIPA